MESTDERIAALETELRVRDERLARVAALVASMQFVPQYLHEEGHYISDLGASLDKLFMTDRHRDTPEAREHVTRAYEGLRRIHADIVGILRKRAPTGTPLGDCLREAVVGLPPVAKRVRLDIASATNSIPVPAELRIALQNLIINADQSYLPTARGEVAVRATVKDDRLLIDVEDHGSGIPTTELANIWSLGYSRRNRPGIGLAVVKHLVESWNGTVNITSTQGRGTTVTLSLPLHYDEHPLD
jgi:signal transduction histidine kinase